MSMDRQNALGGAHLGSADEAEYWFARLLDKDCPADARAAFERWRDADPRHAAAFRDVEQLWKRSANAARDPAIIAAAQRALRQESSMQSSRRWMFPAMAAGLAALVAIVALPRWLSTQTDPVGTDYVTAPGEQKIVQLADGSSIVLDTDTDVVVRYSARTRRVDLLRGQAQFSVHGNREWPFVVHAGHGTVTAVGTEFQIRLNDDTTDVALLHGKLAITALSSQGDAQNASLTGGQSLSFDQGGHITPVHALDAQKTQGWTQGKLFVHDWRLPQLLAEMNRYSTTQLTIGDPALQDIHISGIFRANDQQTFLLLLQQGWSIRARRVSDTQIVLLRDR
ncbi:FecR family protein [Dyella sp. 2HG41-7]|uniref:FecR family protein n=1 Tax=Dyella sp. 2HG41-7 TaxID=2883239 RepID=UPI001F27203D|nr:FecR family protein [Dyella sp. 2HG41-7]